MRTWLIRIKLYGVMLVLLGSCLVNPFQIEPVTYDGLVLNPETDLLPTAREYWNDPVNVIIHPNVSNNHSMIIGNGQLTLNFVNVRDAVSQNLVDHLSYHFPKARVATSETGQGLEIVFIQISPKDDGKVEFRAQILFDGKPLNEYYGSGLPQERSAQADAWTWQPVQRDMMILAYQDSINGLNAYIAKTLWEEVLEAAR